MNKTEETLDIHEMLKNTFAYKCGVPLDVILKCLSMYWQNRYAEHDDGWNPALHDRIQKEFGRQEFVLEKEAFGVRSFMYVTIGENAYYKIRDSIAEYIKYVVK